MVALAVVIALYRLLKIQERLDEKRVFLLLLLIAILMIDSTVFALGDGVGGSNGSYWLPILSLPVLVVIIWIDSEQFVFKHTRKVVGGILLCIVFTISICMIKYFSYTSFRHPIGVEQVTDWLIENGYCNGYSTFWNGHIVEEISNGDIEIWVVNQLATLENTDNMLQSKKHDYTLPTGKIFILVRGDELESIIGISEISNKIVYQDINGFTVFGFDNIDDLDKYIDVN